MDEARLARAVRTRPALLTLLRANATHRSTQAPTTASRPAAVDDTDRWGTWLQDLETTLGPSLTAGLFPTEAAVRADVNSTTVWTVDTDDAAVAEDNEDAVDSDDEFDDLSNCRQPPDVPVEQRRRLQLWAQRLRRAVTATPPPRC